MSIEINDNDILEKVDVIVKKKQVNHYHYLSKFMLKSNSFVVLDTIALAIFDLKYEDGLSSLIVRIDDSQTRNHKATLLYACSAFDCSKYIKTFLRVAFFEKFQSALEALELIRDNCVLSKDLANAGRSLLLELIETENGNPENDEIIEFLVEYLDKIK